MEYDSIFTLQEWFLMTLSNPKSEIILRVRDKVTITIHASKRFPSWTWDLQV